MPYKACLVTGSHRSGSTWVGQTLAKLSSSAYLWEPFNLKATAFYKSFLSPRILSLKHWYSLVPPSDPLWQHLRSLKTSRHGNFKHALTCLSLDNNYKKSINYLLKLCRLQYGLLSSSSLLVKDPLMLLSVESALQSSFVDKAIVLTRDPRAFYSSLKKADWNFDFFNLLGPVNNLSHLSPFHDVVTKRAHEPSLLTPASASDLWNILHQHIFYLSRMPNIFVIRYEDICDNPVNEFVKMMGFFLDRQVDVSVVSKYFRFSETQHAESDIKGVQMVRRGNPSQIANLWKSRVTPAEADCIRQCCCTLMKHFHYY